MPPDRSGLSFRLKTLGSDLNTFWRPVRQKVADQMYDVALLQKFFKEWAQSMENGETSEEGYNDALDILPKDNPDTPFLDESVSEAQLKEKFQAIFKEPMEPSSFPDAEALKNQSDKLQGEIRRCLAQQFSMDSNINAIQAEIDNLRSILNTTTSNNE